MRSNRDPFRRALFAGVLSFVAVVVTTCAVFAPKPKPQEWDEDAWGPLVPHKTFPADCSICHEPDRWDVLKPNFSFDHAKETGVKLEGAHKDAACLRCHNDFGPVKEYVERGCTGCHLDVHRSQLGKKCLECHTMNDWRPAGILAQHAETRFPLTGAHIAVACERCHQLAPTGTYRGTPTQCQICHAADALRSQAFDHQANGWTTRCERCHFPTGWKGANFTHAFFPLIGGHAGLACTECHPGNDFHPISKDCYSCHANEYNGAPNHTTGNYSHNCLNCHSINSWEGARFDHSFFPLTNGHSGLACIDCHTSGVTGPIPSTCVSCHLAEYQGAPNHQSFPQTCQQCHTTKTWAGATFNHTAFPLSGPHNVSCSQCHPNGDTTTFDCLTCHGKAVTDGHHREVRNYQYTSTACYQCHRNGRAD